LELEDWVAFDFSYSLDLRTLIPHILAVEQYKAAALNAVLPPHWLEVSENTVVAAEGGGGAVEHTPWGVYSVSSASDPSSGSGAATEDAKFPVRKITKARQWVKQRFVPGSAALSLPDVLTLHGMVAEEHGVTGPTTGELRTDRVQVGRAEVGGLHQGAPWKRLPELMARYVDFVESPELRSLPPVIQALLAHFFLDTIHPFIDGNGRTSRLVAAAILSRHGYNLHGTYALIGYFYRHEIQYHTMLHGIWTRCPFAVTPFIAFGMAGFVLELKSIDTFIKMKLNRLRDPDLAASAWRRRLGVRSRRLN
jgi:Fic/DOC family